MGFLNNSLRERSSGKNSDRRILQVSSRSETRIKGSRVTDVSFSIQRHFPLTLSGCRSHAETVSDFRKNLTKSARPLKTSVNSSISHAPWCLNVSYLIPDLLLTADRIPDQTAMAYRSSDLLRHRFSSRWLNCRQSEAVRQHCFAV